MNNQKKKKGKLGDIILSLMYILSFMACGIIVADYSYSVGESDAPLIEKLPLMFGVMLLFYAAIMLQFIIHEGGHMIFGLLSGYKFVSFRVGSFMLAKINGRLVFKRYSLAGTGGQCLMSPPDMKNGTVPYKLYNIGGVVNNIIFSSVALALALLVFPVHSLGWAFCIMLSALGFGMALANGLPLSGTVDNDGQNAVSLGSNKSTMRAFWTQLKMNEMQTDGGRLKDMPDEYFELGEGAVMSNPIISSNEIFKAQRLLDMGKYSDAYEALEKLLNSDANILGLHKTMIISDMIYCELIGENRKEKLEALYTREQKKLMNSMKTMISILRTQYAYALLCENDVKKADKIKKQIIKTSQNYPYAGDLESETELIQLVENKYSQLGGEKC